MLKLNKIEPTTKNQELVFNTWKDGDNLVLNGSAGTGKTFVSLYLALEKVLSKSRIKKLIIIRSVVPTRDLGFLPGTVEEKLSAFETPYVNMCGDLFNDKGSYELLKTRNKLEFYSTSYIRGTTFNDAVILVDECQNLNWEELDTIITRVGDHSRIVFCGDYRQTDLRKGTEREGLFNFMEIVRHMNSYARVEFTVNDIVRSDLVKEYIIAKITAEDTKPKQKRSKR